ncbi:MAG: FtsW/RodA/SpoVE family cell cycle protein, partial [Chloroflexi bacterium]|nr:FtsW/RodA/SpoVE family cell cycle protein [Chloroflexota bacterium]
MNRVVDGDSMSISRRILDAFRLDHTLMLLLFILAAFGLLVLFSASGSDLDLMYRQLIRLGLATFLLIVVANISLRVLRKLSVWFYVIGVLLLIAVMVFGEVGKGAQRWLDLGFIRFQPSEFMKLAMPMMLASYLSKKVLPVGWKDLLVSALLIMLPVLLIARQPDLGTS